MIPHRIYGYRHYETRHMGVRMRQEQVHYREITETEKELYECQTLIHYETETRMI